MSMRSRSALLVAVASIFAAALLFVSLPLSPRASAQTVSLVPERSTASIRSPFFGDLASKENDFFYNSLLANYGSLYVPARDAGGGHFRMLQKGGRSTTADASSAAQQPQRVPTTIGVLSGKVKGDPSIDSAQQQRQVKPDVVKMVGPFSLDTDLRDLPYIAPKSEVDEVPLRRHGLDELIQNAKGSAAGSLVNVFHDAPVAANMPTVTNTFAGMNSNLACGTCLPPDTDGDVGPNHYVQSVNSSLRVHDKAGNVLAGPVTFNSFFSAMGTSTPCGNNNNGGDPVVFYDHISDRWVISNFAFPAFPGTAFYQCIGVSKTSDPISGGYWLYAVQVDPANTNLLGDYPKFGMWPDAYYLSVNLFSNNTTFNGVRVFALDRNSMMNGGPANTVAFTILPADLGDQYSLVPASFRTGNPPPAGQPEWFLDINSSATAGTVETQVFVRRFHVDFATPANSTFGVGAAHTPDGIITVNGFVDAFDGTNGTSIVPNGTATTTQYLDTLGDKLMYPLIYQNLGGTESIWATHTVNNNQGGTGPTGIRWYQFDMSGNSIPAAPVQQQTFTNGGDGLWRAMPSINVDRQGNMSVGYTASSATLDPGIRYAGRLAGDPLNTLGQGEGVMAPGLGHQTSTSHRWGDYSTMFVDPSDSCTFYHTNEYYSATGSATWNTRVGAFKFAGCTPSPVPTPTPTPAPTATPTPTPTPAGAGPVTVIATAGTVGPTDYPTLKGAFDAVNAGTHQGAVTIYIFGDTVETASAVLNASGSGSALYTSISVLPTGARTVSGSLAAPLIDLNGASNVTINGLKTGGNSLTLSNTSTANTAGTSTVRFINKAQNDLVTNCSIQGSSTVPLGTAGGNVLFSTTTATGAGAGNNGNSVTGNDIGPAGSNLPTKAVSALGTAGNNTRNIGDVISGNNIFDFFNPAANTAGIDIRAGNVSFVISNNRIFQTTTRTFTTTALRYSGILVSGTTGASGDYHSILGNTIGFASPAGTGTTVITGSSNEVRGIDLQGANSSTSTSVQGNQISGIDQTSSRASTTTGLSAFTGISISTSGGASATGVFDVGTITGNTIGSLDGSSTIVVNATSTTASTAPVFGILAFSGSSNNVSNNKIGAITIQGSGTVTGFRGIFAGSTAGTTHTISNNIVGGVAAGGGITDLQIGDYAVYGIQTSTATVTIVGNTVRNLNGNATSNATGAVVGSGISVSSSGTSSANVISRNVIHSLRNDTASANLGAIYALDVTLPASTSVTGNLIERNSIHSLAITSGSTSSQIWGIVLRGSGTAGVPTTATVQNNMVRLGIDAAGNAITGGFSIIGIRDIQGATGGAGTSVVSYYFNSVYIGGSGVTAASNTYCFNGSALTSTRNYKDNIFFNARSNASGAGKNYAISLAGTAPSPAGLTSNYNDLFANGTGGATGLFNGVDANTLADWQTATGQDANSISADPKFVSPNGTALAASGGTSLWQTVSDLLAGPNAAVDLHLQAGSPAIGIGTAVTATSADPLMGITNDFDGNLRTGATSLGAATFLAPTAARVSISGRVLAPDGAGLRNAIVVMRDANGGVHSAITSSFGYYSFDSVEIGNYLVSVSSKRFRYETRPLAVNDALTGVDFTPVE